MRVRKASTLATLVESARVLSMILVWKIIHDEGRLGWWWRWRQNWRNMSSLRSQYHKHPHATLLHCILILKCFHTLCSLHQTLLHLFPDYPSGQSLSCWLNLWQFGRDHFLDAEGLCRGHLDHLGPVEKITTFMHHSWVPLHCLQLNQTHWHTPQILKIFTSFTLTLMQRKNSACLHTVQSTRITEAGLNMELVQECILEHIGL